MIILNVYSVIATRIFLKFDSLAINTKILQRIKRIYFNKFSLSIKYEIND